jgi:hypothetical protein
VTIFGERSPLLVYAVPEMKACTRVAKWIGVFQTVKASSKL